MTLLDSIRPNVAATCLVRSCGMQGCKVPLKNAPQPRLILDLDKPGSPLGGTQTRCDYLIVAEGDGGTGWVVPLELKHGQARSGVLAQLQSGADVADRILPNSARVALRPVVAARGIHSQSKKALLKAKVRFRGRAEAVKLITCGTPRAKALGT